MQILDDFTSPCFQVGVQPLSNGGVLRQLELWRSILFLEKRRLMMEDEENITKTK
jgi:hypothetical protein